uniref:Uncharacterized protein n=1 Tax=Arundo donax TaxID=35708 RepID=A0A0A9GTL5_ARUDO
MRCGGGRASSSPPPPTEIGDGKESTRLLV